MYEREAVSFVVVDRSDGQGVRGPYAGDWPGVVRPMLDWRVEAIEDSRAGGMRILPTPRTARSLRAPVVVFSLLVGLGLLIAWPSLHYGFSWDDLHLIRTYDAAEMLSTLTGPWDPDGIETSGLRPLTTGFNEARALLFGEDTAAHRLFLVALYAMALTLLAGLARALGASAAAAGAGAMFALAAKNSYYHYVWIADGIHVLQLLLVVLAIRSLHLYARSSRSRHLAGAMALYGLALLTREDSLAAVPLLLMVPLIAVSAPTGWRQVLSDDRWTWFRHAAVGFATLLLVWWMWRLSVVDGAQGARFSIEGLSDVVRMLLWTVSLVGGSDPAWPLYVGLAILGVIMTAWLPAGDRRRASLWLGAAVWASFIGIVLARPNVLILPAACYGMFLGEVFVGLARLRRALVPIASIVAIIAVGFAVQASRLEQLSLHPQSALQIAHEWEFVAGPYSGATIPATRREAIQARLTELGLASTGDVARFSATLLDQKRIGYQADGGPFVPERPFLEWPDPLVYGHS